MLSKTCEHCLNSALHHLHTKTPFHIWHHLTMTPPSVPTTRHECRQVSVGSFTHSFSSRVMHTTSLTPGLLALSQEQPCRLQVARRTTGFPSRRPGGGSTLGRTEMIWVGPPGGRSRSSLMRLNEVGLGWDLVVQVNPPLVLVDGALERSTNTWKRILSSRELLMWLTLTRSSMLLNGPCSARYATMFLAIFSVMPRMLMSCAGVAVLMFIPVHDWWSRSLRREDGECWDELVLLETHISSLITSSLVAPIPLTRARSSTFLNPPIQSRYSTMFCATVRLTPGRVMSSSSVAVLMFSRSWFTRMWPKLHAALNLRLPQLKSVGSLGMERWQPRLPPMTPAGDRGSDRRSGREQTVGHGRENRLKHQQPERWQSHTFTPPNTQISPSSLHYALVHLTWYRTYAPHSSRPQCGLHAAWIPHTCAAPPGSPCSCSRSAAPLGQIRAGRAGFTVNFALADHRSASTHTLLTGTRQLSHQYEPSLPTRVKSRRFREAHTGTLTVSLQNKSSPSEEDEACESV